MTIKAAFQPRRGVNLTATPGAASASVALDSQAKSVRLVNTGANICFVRIGSGAQTATTADMPVRAASEIIVSKGDGDDTLAHISAAGTTLYIQTGEGGI
jgi:hypothetical protein